MLSEIGGLFTCDQCGASVAGDGTAIHLNWHAEIDETFLAMAEWVKEITKKVDDVS
ncbi:MAG: hypothetical protein LC723_14680 [Actinobacteria bacterium]|nr:hypothetical protein [Actinomycetota bacterium]